MTTTENSTLRITGPADLLAAVPYLLGFHPEDSLVIVGLADRRVVVTVRIDLADIGEQDHYLSDTMEAIVRAGTTKLVGAVYTETQPDAGGPLPHAEVAVELGREAERLGVAMTDCLLVASGRWWSYTRRDAACCPAEGAALPASPTPLDAAATYAGLTALPNRQALASMLNSLPDRADLAADLVAQQDPRAERNAERRPGQIRTFGGPRAVRRAPCS